MGLKKKYKILISVVVIIISFAVLIFGTAYYFIGKINITDENTPVATAATLPKTTTTTADGKKPAAEKATTVTQTANDEAEVFPDAEKLDGEEKKAIVKANKDIKDNLDDNRIWQSDKVKNILLLGIDYGTETLKYGRSDAMMILSLNKAIQKVKIVSISRNVYSSIPGFKNSMISHAHAFGGPTLAIKTVEQNYKIGIDNYVSCSFDSFVKIIDLLGGVDINLTEKEKEALNESGSSFASAGKNTLNGETALRYVRLRSIDSDKERTGRQRNILMALAEKFKGISIQKAFTLLNTVLPLINTDMRRSEILFQLANAVKYLSWDIQQYYIPNKAYDWVIRNNFYVNILDWPYELSYAHALIFEGVTPNYKELENE